MTAFDAGFVQIGTFFDDGGNFKSDYDTKHNDYARVDHGLSMFIAQIRNAFGDPQPPTYDYWAARGKAGDMYISRFYISLNWILWFF